MITIYDRNLIHSTITETPVWGNADNFSSLIIEDNEEKQNMFKKLAQMLGISRIVK